MAKLILRNNLDTTRMQGITEAVSKYYYSNRESFSGISVTPEYQGRFEELANEAMEYYDNQVVTV